jgi:polar amino acid transport system permease protein
LERVIENFFDPVVIERYGASILQGVWVTLGIGLAVVVTGIALGFLLAVIRTFRIKPVNIAIVWFVDWFRALPPLALILIIFFGLPNIGVVMPGLVVLWLSLSLILAAFCEEVFWAGITAIPAGQWLAGRATGLTGGQTLFHIVLPQAVRMTIPPLTNRAINITKNTSLGSAIGVSDVLGRAMATQSLASDATPLLLAAIIYVVLFMPMVVASRFIERRFAGRTGR